MPICLIWQGAATIWHTFSVIPVLPRRRKNCIREALKIRRELAEKSPDAYLPDLAISCNNLAYLLSDTGSSKEAEELYREALKIRRELAEKSPDAYLPNLATSCNNLAALLHTFGSFKEAEKNCTGRPLKSSENWPRKHPKPTYRS
jgi:tetratricopeptide (TPR) repeat protein